MQEILELQTGQVAFLSALLSGFSLSIAVHILRHGIRQPAAQFVFCCLIITTLLFLISLYVDVRLTIELAGITEVTDAQSANIVGIRTIGTHAATAAFVLFLLSIGSLGWIASTMLGIISSFVALTAFAVLAYVWYAVQNML